MGSTALAKVAAIRFGERLCHAQWIDQAQLRIALGAQRQGSLMIGEVFLQLGFIEEAPLYALLAQHLGVALLATEQLVAEPSALRLFDPHGWRTLMALPIARHALQLTVAMTRPNDRERTDRLRQRLPSGYTLLPRLAAPHPLQRAIEQQCGGSDGAELQALWIALDQYDDLPDARGRTVIRAVDVLLQDAAKRGATDIHFEPESHILRIRYRIDGVLQTVHCLPAAHWLTFAVRLKVISGMNIAETRAPQDGRFSVTYQGGQLECRCAILPTVHGENFAIRLLDRQRGLRPIAQLGLAADTLHHLQQLLLRPSGLLLITGPTGSGKTSTLYSILRHLAHDGVNIMTLEDPVEYLLSGVRQTQIDESVRLDFASGVRALLRQDPDILLIGEIRDADTAAMALRAAMSGHRVLATLHAASALHAPCRLHELGVSAALLSCHLIGIIGQRLLRRVCPHCVRQGPTDALAQGWLQATQMGIAVGCTRCDQSGYRGRFAVLEIVRIHARLERALAQSRHPAALVSIARASGWRSLAESAIAYVRAGETTFAEAARLIDLSETNPSVVQAEDADA